MTQLLSLARAVSVCAALSCASMLACSSTSRSSDVASGGVAGTPPHFSGGTTGDSPATTGGRIGSDQGGSANIAGATALSGGAGVATTSSGGNASGGIPAGGGANGGSSDAAGGAAGVAGAPTQAGAAGAQWSSTLPSFTKHTVASFSAGYATCIADIDHDGKPDVVALSSGSAGLVWFKNPSWQRYTITSSAKQLIFMAPYDVNGDGHLDLAVVSDFDMNNSMSGGTISWAEAPADPTQNKEWELHRIDAVPTAHRLRWADIDGDGKKELIVLPLFGVGSMAPAHAGAVQLKAYPIPQDPKGSWTGKVLDNQHLEVAHGIEIVDWDGDKAEDILTAANDGVDLFRPALATSYQHLGAGADGDAPTRGSSEVGLGSLGGQRFIATIDPWHGTDGVIYTPGASDAAPWTRQDLGADFEHGHGLAVADFNGDGFDEVVAGGGQGAMMQLIYRYVPSSHSWDKIQLDLGGVAVSGIDVADMDGDGDIDVVSIGGSPTNNVVWYENSR